MVLVCVADIVLQVLLLVIKLHLAAKQLILIMTMLLLLLINGIEPQMEVRKLTIQVLIKVGCIKTRRARRSAAPSH